MSRQTSTPVALDYAAVNPPLERIPAACWRVFAWLFWGDFVLVLMEQVVPSLVPIMLNQHKLSNTAIAWIMGTVPLMFGLLIMPIISYRSDQLRTRWGRRIPFLVLATPLIMCSLCAIPFSPEIAQRLDNVPWLHSAFQSLGIGAITVSFAVTITAYTFFNAVCSACYTYLLPDVVPQQFMGRFISAFRIISLAGVFIFGQFFMGVANTYMKELFLGAALVYGLGFAVVCFRIREPDYPPPQDRRIVNPLAIFGSYARECFRHPVYRWLYAAFALYGISQVAGNLFDTLFMNKTLGMDLGMLGKVRAWSAIAPVPLAYLCGHLIDRWKSQRAIILFAVLLAIGKLAGYFLITGPTSYLVLTIAYNCVAFFWGVTYSTYLISMLPKDRYGQFVSCNLCMSQLIVLTVSPLCGLFFDWAQDYRYVYLWPTIFMLLAALLFWKVNRYWHRLGGPSAYQAP